MGGTWKKIGNVVQVVIGGYSVAEGTMENNIIRLEGSNSEGGKFRMLLTPKAP